MFGLIGVALVLGLWLGVCWTLGAPYDLEPAEQPVAQVKSEPEHLQEQPARKREPVFKLKNEIAQETEKKALVVIDKERCKVELAVPSVTAKPSKVLTWKCEASSAREVDVISAPALLAERR